MTTQTQNHREFFRLMTEMDVKFKTINPGEIDHDILFLKSHQGKAVDLSGGGAVILSEIFTEPGTLLKVKLIDPGLHLPPVEASVIRVEPLTDGNYKAAVKFVNIFDEDVKKILSYLNQQLIKQTRKRH